MTFTKKKEGAKDPLTQRVIPHAYALIADPDHPGWYFGVHLENVVAEKVTHIEKSQRSSWPLLQLNRVINDMRHRDLAKGWTK